MSKKSRSVSGLTRNDGRDSGGGRRPSSSGQNSKPQGRRKLPPSTFHEFLHRRVNTRMGPMSGREALIEIAFLPVALAHWCDNHRYCLGGCKLAHLVPRF